MKKTPRAVSKKSRTYERKDAAPLALTPLEYGELQAAYDHFNAALFGQLLPDVFITYQRHANSKGHFAADRFSGRSGAFGRHELALNPDGFVDRSDEQIVSTLVHEMVHAWQQVHGKPSAGYHNKEWAAKMKSVGLQLSSTGMVGGKETGARMTHYIIPHGAFAQAFADLAATGWGLNLQSAHESGPKTKPNSKTKVTCSRCGQNAWGKPDLAIICEPCGITMHAVSAAAAPASAARSYDQTEVLQ